MTQPSIALRELGDVSIDEWDELAERVGVAPYLYGGFLSAWCQTMAAGATVNVATARRGAELCGVLPLVASRVSHFSPPRYGQVGAVADDEDTARLLWGRIFREVRPRSVRLGPVSRDALGLDPVRLAASDTGYTVRPQRLEEQPVVDCATDWDTYLAGLSKNTRKDIRRRRRRLDERGELTLEVSRGPDALGADLNRAIAIEGSGWKGSQGSAIRNSPSQVAFYRRLSEWAAGRGALEIAFLTLDGQAIAMHYSVCFHDVLYALKSGFDEHHADLAPGTVVLAAEIERTFEEGRRRFHFAGQVADYKLRWATGAESFDWVDIDAPGIGGNLTRWGRDGVRRARELRSRRAAVEVTPADGLAGRHHRS
ncbi:MAG: GNAT family N-acetyltransferase [Miltoncostaeaceae bacterium]